MKDTRLNSKGFAHHVVLLAIVAVMVTGGVFATVIRVNNNSNAKNSQNTSDGSADSKNKLGADGKSQSELSTANGSDDSANSTTPSSNTPAPTPTTTPSTPTTTPKNNSTTPSNAPTETPLSVLIALITKLKNGEAGVYITANAVTIPGPINDATARPIVFTANGQKYFAYRQGSAPNFNTSPTETANTMAIVSATGSPSLEDGRLNKVGNLVDQSSMGYLVGYSEGGDNVR
jgi:cytoskeletal protein RodZ